MSTERPQLVDAGMMCWQNTNEAFMQTAMGWLKDGDSFTDANFDNYVSYCENHDEERSFFKAKQWGAGNVSSSEEARFKRIPLNIGFQCMLNGPQLFYHFAEIGFDYSKFQKSDGTWGTDGIEAYGEGTATPSVKEEAKMQVKARPENLGWFDVGPRMNGCKRLGQIIQLRTRLLPGVFEGNPSEANISSGYWIRSVRWGNDVYAVGNFTATDAQDVTLPSGTWYDYLDGGGKANSSYTLQPGDIKIFTGKQLSAPNIPNSYSFEQGIEQVNWESTFSSPEAVKFYHEGQIYILREGNIYDLMGRKVQ